ncbi:thiamine pyrophosphate-binding protein [Nakamurella sp. A5-74]|uniref:Thiamine pyrophosphate-binding protein n=1 Tax=Nakamurella sp. A5-74 TaxID=3158264 RepID=A0AAU8DNG4_9ACTN
MTSLRVPAHSRSTVSSAVLAALRGAGITDVFGVMGNGNVHFLDAVCTSDLRFTALRHEAGGVAAADAFARFTGRPAVATATYGAGFTNTITPLAEAVRARTPLLLVAGDAPSTGPRGWDVDQVAMAAAAGAQTFVVDASAPGRTTIAALQYAVDERTAVVLSLPHDVGASPTSEDPDDVPSLQLRIPAGVDPLAIDAAADVLADARALLVLAGRGVRAAGATAALTDLADRLDAATCTTAPALGTFAGSPRDLGVAGGFSSPGTLRRIAAADVVLVVGAALNQFTTAFGSLFAPDAIVVQIDDAPFATSARVDLFVRGDAAEAVRQLNFRLTARRGPAPSAVRRRAAGRTPVDPTTADGTDEHERGDALAPDGRLDPRSLFRRLDDLLPDDRVIVSDGGHFIGWAPMYLRVPAADRLVLVGTALQSIGLGLPSGVGVAVAAGRDEFVVVVSGDGGGLMALADLESLARATRRGALIVVNDAAYGAEIHQFGAASLGLDETPMRIPEVDFAALGAAVGGRSAVIRTLEDLAVLRDFVVSGADGLLVLDCRVSADVVAPYISEMAGAARRLVAANQQDRAASLVAAAVAD